MKRLSLLLTVILAMLCGQRVSAQENSGQVDSLVSLLSAKSLRQVEENGIQYRKVIGPARFFHNNTYLICDTAYWFLNTEIIDAIGNVKILQNETVLTGDSLRYIVNSDLAQFRGHLVQLEDKDHNVLRTRHLDYNTKDSVAVFNYGGALKDAEGQVIESTTGSYDSKVKTFTFSENVNMFTDSIFVKTSRLQYHTDTNMAIFGYGTDAWKDENMLSANAGWYDRANEIFLFNRQVHAMGDAREAWSDSLYFYRNTMDIDLRGNVQLSDSLRNVTALAGRVEYTDSLSQVVMTRLPAIVSVVDTTGQPRDTVYMSSLKMVYHTKPKCTIPPSDTLAAATRLKDVNADAITAYRQKAAEDARKAAEEAIQNDPEQMARRMMEQASQPSQPATPPEEKPSTPAKTADRSKEAETPPSPEPGPALAASPDSAMMSVPDSLRGAMASIPDSLGMVNGNEPLMAGADSLSAQTDSLMVEPGDSTKVGFLSAIGKVKLYREDIQIACDSLEYTDLDSLIRMYKDPIVWNEGNRQYRSDSLFAVIRNQSFEKASLMSNAFVIIEEAPSCYDQIRASEMLAYFDKNNNLERFDALGEVNAVFYLKEDSTYATVNKSQAKMLYALFADGDIKEVSYYDTPKSDAYPLAQMTSDDRVLKGFNWEPDSRPKGPEDITSYVIRPSQKEQYRRRPRATYTQTDRFFPGYMAGVYKQIEEREKAERERKASAPEETPPEDVPVSPEDTSATDNPLLPPSDTSSVAASVDSLAVPSVSDSLAVSADSLSSPAKVLTEKEMKKAEREAARKLRLDKQAARVAAKEARWAVKDSLDAVALQAKLDKKQAKLRRRTLRTLERQRAQDEVDAEKLAGYVERYAKKKQKQDERAAAKAAAKAAKDAEKGSASPAVPTMNEDPEIARMKSMYDSLMNVRPDSLMAAPDSSLSVRMTAPEDTLSAPLQQRRFEEKQVRILKEEGELTEKGDLKKEEFLKREED
ncbi:MAG: hypothetical protein IJ584_02620 [Bacteroidales bacterium]|nr:hypothetical protein [Bacteroidales bacterium]